MTDKYFSSEYSPIAVVGEMNHGSYEEGFAFIDANAVGGVFRVQNTADIQNLSDDILRNIGFRVYSLQDNCFFRLID